MRVGSKTGQNFELFEKQGRAGGEVCRDYSCHTSVLSTGIRFKFYQATIGGLVTSAVGVNKKD